MKPYTHILFDLDGTITDPAEGITTCVRHALHCQGIEEENYQNLCRMIGPPLAEGFRDFYDMDEEHAWQAVRDFRELFAKIGVEKNIPYPGMKEALLRLRTPARCCALPPASRNRSPGPLPTGSAWQSALTLWAALRWTIPAPKRQR